MIHTSPLPFSSTRVEFASTLIPQYELLDLINNKYIYNIYEETKCQTRISMAMLIKCKKTSNITITKNKNKNKKNIKIVKNNNYKLLYK